jgi:hypothetical protein
MLALKGPSSVVGGDVSKHAIEAAGKQQTFTAYPMRAERGLLSRCDLAQRRRGRQYILLQTLQTGNGLPEGTRNSYSLSHSAISRSGIPRTSRRRRFKSEIRRWPRHCRDGLPI